VRHLNEGVFGVDAPQYKVTGEVDAVIPARAHTATHSVLINESALMIGGD